MPKKTKKRAAATFDTSSSQDVLPVDDPDDPQLTQDKQPISQDMFVSQDEDEDELVDFDEEEDDDVATTSANQNVPLKRSRRDTYTPLPHEDERNLVEWYQSNPMLYNRKMSQYRDIPKKNRLYQDKAQELQIHVDRLRKWIENMRTRYGKLCVHPSGDGAPDESLLSDRDQFILTKFAFLKPHIVRCPTRKSQTLVSRPPVQEQQPPSSSDTAPTPIPDVEEEKDTEAYRQLQEKLDKQGMELEQMRVALNRVNKTETEIEMVARAAASYVGDVLRCMPLLQAVRTRHKIVELLQQADVDRMHMLQQPTYPAYQPQQYQPPQYPANQQQWPPSAPLPWSSTPAPHQAPTPSTSSLNSGLGFNILVPQDGGSLPPTAQLVSTTSTSSSMSTPKKK